MDEVIKNLKNHELFEKYRFRLFTYILLGFYLIFSILFISWLLKISENTEWIFTGIWVIVWLFSFLSLIREWGDNIKKEQKYLNIFQNMTSNLSWKSVPELVLLFLKKDNSETSYNKNEIKRIFDQTLPEIKEVRWNKLDDTVLQELMRSYKDEETNEGKKAYISKLRMYKSEGKIEKDKTKLEELKKEWKTETVVFSHYTDSCVWDIWPLVKEENGWKLSLTKRWEEVVEKIKAEK